MVIYYIIRCTHACLGVSNSDISYINCVGDSEGSGSGDYNGSGGDGTVCRAPFIMSRFICRGEWIASSTLTRRQVAMLNEPSTMESTQ